MIKRILSALVLIPLVLWFTIYGDDQLLIEYTLFWFAASALVFYEWLKMVKSPRPRIYLAFAIVLYFILFALFLLLQSPMVGVVWLGIVALMLVLNLMFCGHGMTILGFFYASVIAVAPVLLREDNDLGLLVMLWIYATVWMSDTFAYVFGKWIGGAKLCPSISPNKTWSGFVGGTVAGTLAGLLILQLEFMISLKIVLLAIGLSLMTHLGDLFESYIKRKYEVKDSGSIIPGHGGVMDRLDGFVFAVLFALLLGMIYGGISSPSTGLMVLVQK